jgi:hypothetical protein
LPHQGYSNEGAARERIADFLDGKLRLSKFQLSKIKASADALDAVVAAMAGVAVSTNRVLPMPSSSFGAEGWIAIHE